MKRYFKLVCSAGVLAALTVGMSGCVSYGNSHALITPVGIAGYHTFKPANAPRDVPRNIELPQDPNRIAAVKDEQKQSEDDDT